MRAVRSRHNRRWIAGSLVLSVGLLGQACSLAALEERELPYSTNTCGGEDDCAGNSLCSTLLQPAGCASSTGSFFMVLFRVSPSASASKLAGQELFLLAEEAPAVGSSGYPLVFPEPTALTTTVSATLPADCGPAWGVNAGPPPSGTSGAGGAASSGQSGGATAGGNTNAVASERIRIDARVTFYPTERRWGIAAKNHTLEVSRSQAASSMVPVGSYDIYVEPLSVPESSADLVNLDCQLAPQLWRATALSSGATRLALELPRPARLQLEINAQGRDLDDYSLALIEPNSGQVVSSRRTLKANESALPNRTYSVQINYTSAADSESALKSELVRLSPPEGRVAPTLYFERTALELFSKGSAKIELSAPLPKPVSFEGQVIDEETGQPEQAAVRLVASSLEDLPPGTLGAFMREVDTDDEGRFRVDLLPGSYRVRAVPSRSRWGRPPLAPGEVTWQVAQSPAQQAGRTLLLRPAPRVVGRLLLPAPSGQGAQGVALEAEPSPWSLSSSVLSRELGQAPEAPSALNDIVTPADGAFELYAQPGTYDLSARPPAGSGFPWFVMSGFEVPSDREEVRVGELQLTWPVALPVLPRITSNSEAEFHLNGAQVRAYALVTPSGKPAAELTNATAAVPIADAQVDEDGRALLLLPASLNDRVLVE